MCIDVPVEMCIDMNRDMCIDCVYRHVYVEICTDMHKRHVYGQRLYTCMPLQVTELISSWTTLVEDSSGCRVPVQDKSVPRVPPPRRVPLTPIRSPPPTAQQRAVGHVPLTPTRTAKAAAWERKATPSCDLKPSQARAPTGGTPQLQQRATSRAQLAAAQARQSGTPRTAVTAVRRKEGEGSKGSPKFVVRVN